MLDQNTTTVLTTLVTVGGTLGGVVLGVVLTNRYTWKQEKAKRNTSIIEEVYTLINKIDEQVEECISENKSFAIDLRDKSDRVNTLINLYLRSIKKNYTEYTKALWVFMDLLRYNLGSSFDFEKIEEDKRYVTYKNSFVEILHSLEKLVR